MQYKEHLYWNSRQSWHHISRLIYSFTRDFLGDLPHFPWSHCTLTSQLLMETLWGNLQKDWDPFVLTLHKRVQTLQQIEKYKLMPETRNFCSSWRICGKSCTVLPCAPVLMSVREHKSVWKNISSSTLCRHLTWLGMLSLSRTEKQICSLDSLFSAFLEFKVSFYSTSSGLDDCCVYICWQINKSVHLHMLRYGQRSKTKIYQFPYKQALLHHVSRYYQVVYIWLSDLEM